MQKMLATLPAFFIFDLLNVNTIGWEEHLNSGKGEN